MPAMVAVAVLGQVPVLLLDDELLDEELLDEELEDGGSVLEEELLLLLLLQGGQS